MNNKWIGLFQVFATCVLRPLMAWTQGEKPHRFTFSEKTGNELHFGKSDPPSNESIAKIRFSLPRQPAARQHVDRPLKLPISTMFAASGRDRAASKSHLPSATHSQPSIES